MFETKWNREETQPTNSGSPIAPVYKLTADNDLEVDGEINLYDEIQSHADSVDIYTILSRFEQGDEGVLSKRNGQYVDLTELPTTFAEMHQKIIDASNEFNALPLEIRSEYEFDVSKFIADIGSEHWFKLLSPTKEDSVTKTVEKSEEKVEKSEVKSVE